ncbi:tRNA (adenosine(37)-N6)-threonylcarbamoyltransferase complex dimerization subunit type 1 TsaB [Nocardia otitidiscaviarum]|uniref:tRNA (adenosine(37)-N6)-threonylcarbamoyltransferase complex dimerization subunit type 1 TsaB n=1 Tax=Nocardia otitidiscaviarum TaxID=1823 RepID=UPI001892D317|nr:tRNA (adenosine(37)-N6)-threonylcarbamoyltransferase complex dimerization subunit type 1 TsaB [Nocardia otitidiscaviarum]MBF6235688.1 tRNA (adenosine(37)-N6)-threonylcarbamoyltransferase complex dimerization subunit type 1 TsaB [Nocardia otitidiscaviarum]
MLVLAVDTATPAVTAGLVELDPAEAGSTPRTTTIATRVTVDARAHNEVLTPQILACLAESGRARGEIDAVVVGVGPGPFTGLRVGMATAAAFGDALGIPVHGVCSLDAIAADTESYLAEAQDPVELLVVTDARRREVYWARYRALSAENPRGRVAGPEVCKPADLDTSSATVIAGSASHVDYFDLPVLPVETPSPAGLVRCAARDLLSGAMPDPLTPLYLRRPDAVERSYAQVSR